MGGIGSGRRWHLGAKNTTDAYRSIDVRRWQRDGFLTPGRAFGWSWHIDDEQVASIRVRVEYGRVFLMYRHRDEAEDWCERNYPVFLDSTPCNLGGARQWFRCPARGCGRRVAMLYCGGLFACRHCHQLAYPSQREGFADRSIRRAETIRAKLGWEPGTADGHGPKPKGMHWRTYRHLCYQHDVHSNAGWSSFFDRYGEYL